MLINNIDLYNPLPKKISFKQNDNDKKNKEIKDKIFFVRENTKEANKMFDFLFATLFIASTMFIPNASQKDNKYNFSTYLACLTPFLLVNAFSGPKLYGEEYKRKVQNTELKKEKPWKYLLAGIAPALFIGLEHIMSSEKSTPKDGMYKIAGAAIGAIGSLATYFLKNQAVENCENEVSKLKSQLA